MAEKPSDGPQPPKVPDIERRLHLYPWQWIGLPVLLAIPIFALFGAFGESFAGTTDRSAEINIEVDYSTRYRYKMLNSINVRVRNVSSQPIDTLTVALDEDYASQFSTVTAIPSFSEPYIVELLDVNPDEERLIRIQLQAEEYGRHQGELTATSGSADTARVDLSTFIFP